MSPELTEAFTISPDKGIGKIFQGCTGINVGKWTSFAKERMRIPTCFKYCGLREVCNMRHAQYIGTIVQSIPALIDSITYNNCTVKGKLHIPYIVEIPGGH